MCKVPGDSDLMDGISNYYHNGLKVVMGFILFWQHTMSNLFKHLLYTAFLIFLAIQCQSYLMFARRQTQRETVVQGQSIVVMIHSLVSTFFTVLSIVEPRTVTGVFALS